MTRGSGTEVGSVQRGPLAQTPQTEAVTPQASREEAPLHRPVISVVVPVYREEANIRPFLRRVEPVLGRLGRYEILFCLDPSPDATEAVILEEIKRNPSIGLLVLSRRFGQPSAVMAGLRYCAGDSCVVIDVDLQDPPELIEELYARLREGFDVVYAKRRSRRGETMSKLFVSWLGYKLINWVADVSIPRNTGDFRIMSRRVVDHLVSLKEGHGFLRGLVAFVGFRQTFVEYDRDRRAQGRGKYNRYLGSLRIGLNGLVGFSNFLLRAVLVSGIGIAIIAFMLAVAIVISRLFFDIDYPIGIPTLIVLVLFMGGVQLVSIGILGEYLGRVYDEVKQRPQFIVDRVVNVAGRETWVPSVDEREGECRSARG
jgi:glycosyltransferase involved in cell wall biosynthesis